MCALRTLFENLVLEKIAIISPGVLYKEPFPSNRRKRNTQKRRPAELF